VESDVVPVDEAHLERFGIVRLEVPVPFVEAGGPANVYVISNADGSLSLFDTGIGTPEGTRSMFAQATARHIDLGRVTRIIVSHGHDDHFGNAQLLAEQTGARVFVHPLDIDKVAGEFRYSAALTSAREYFLSLGFPPDTLDRVAARSQSPSLSRPVERSRIEPLHEGHRFEFAHFSVNVMHLPGHTPGLVCLHSEAPRLLFADDHVLARVSPNPLLDLSLGSGETKFLSLVEYLKSAHRVRALELDIVLPGHGAAFSGHRTLLDGLFDFYVKRQAKLLQAIRSEAQSAFSLIHALFSRVDDPRLYLLLSETLANLEVLEQTHQVRKALLDGVNYYHPVTA
jgi:glyoxylase-like metal-dependent hydrolase (beta-lactamase superfamily II)